MRTHAYVWAGSDPEGACGEGGGGGRLPQTIYQRGVLCRSCPRLADYGIDYLSILAMMRFRHIVLYGCLFSDGWVKGPQNKSGETKVRFELTP